ncbi:hypothetical protein [Nonlabens agnitus]|uniref:Uncharacterized protein n=1 Tax=Nonlabens agnitus TaxID=870484 RepID=A0A2S9WXB8_9FLAO|nr:hypothetical protein [Nonlabens agnitus]PRP68118.1 hypothetical protein BST86_13985 [Nonlabens agnitus]
MSTEETTQKKEPRFNAIREHGRNWVRDGLTRIKEIPGELKDAKKVAKTANSRENLGDDRGLNYLKKL